MLTSAVQRRFPPGLKLQVVDGPDPGAKPGGQLAALAAALRDWGLSVTRCKVRETAGASAGGGGAPRSHTFYLAAGDGRIPSRDVVRQACEAAGGEELRDHVEDGASAAGVGVGVGGAAGGVEEEGEAEVGSIPRSWSKVKHGKFGFAFAKPSRCARPTAAAGGVAAASRVQQLRRASGGGGSGAPWGGDGSLAGTSFDSGHTMSF